MLTYEQACVRVSVRASERACVGHRRLLGAHSLTVLCASGLPVPAVEGDAAEVSPDSWLNAPFPQLHHDLAHSPQLRWELGSPLPHLRRDRARRATACARCWSLLLRAQWRGSTEAGGAVAFSRASCHRRQRPTAAGAAVRRIPQDHPPGQAPQGDWNVTAKETNAIGPFPRSDRSRSRLGARSLSTVRCTRRMPEATLVCPRPRHAEQSWWRNQRSC